MAGKSAQVDSDPDFPRSFGKYQLLRSIGKGGMAEVFLGRPKGQRRLVAIKCVKRNLATDQQFVDMFIREGNLAVRLDHDFIVKTYEIGRVAGVHFICMEYISGVDLSLIIRRSRSHRTRRLPVPHTVFIASCICEGLHYAHTLTDSDGKPLNLVNRDVSASNVRLSFDGEVKLLDFGIAKATSGLRSEIGVLKGKITNMSPEQVRGLPLDHRSDIFSAGIVLHEMLTGEKLFRGNSEFQTMDNVRRAEVHPPSRSNPRVPADLDQVALRALQRSPQDRYQSAAEMARDMREILNRYSFMRHELRDLVRELCRDEYRREQEIVSSSLAKPQAAPTKDARSEDADYGEFVEIFFDESQTSSIGAPPARPQGGQPWWIYALLGLSVAMLALAVALVVLR